VTAPKHHDDWQSGGNKMPRSYFRFLAIAVVLIPANLFGQGQRAGTAPALHGVLTVKAKEGTTPPDSFWVILFNRDKSEFGRQAVANHGAYSFRNISIGDWEIAVEAGGLILGRIAVTVNPTGGGDMRQDLVLEWGDKSGPTNPGAISSLESYSRTTEGESLMKQALAARSRKNSVEATNLLKKVVAADARDFEAWTELGNVLFAQGHAKDAEFAFRRALEEKPNYAVALLNLGKMQYGQKNYDAAIATLTELTNSHPEFAEAHRFLGESYLRIKRGSNAVPELEEAARLDPHNQADAHLSLAALYDAAGLRDRAAGEYEKFLAMRSNYPDKKKLEKYIRDNKKLRSSAESAGWTTM